MIPAMPPTASRSARQASVSALRFGRVATMGAIAALIVFAGVWGSWGNAQHVLLTKGREQGTVKVTACADGTCSGPFSPTSAGARARARVEIAEAVAVRKGRTYDVVLKPGGSDALRSGPAGILYAWVPLGGALLLASVVVAGGMRLRRVAWGLGLAGAGLLTAAFIAVQ
ncbi:hypothetical protein ACFYMX_20845 [Streptomyces griseofuscus]|uniref:hypothetical protein n=1 Tax=Streptomyces TaxID=1883 RepID=UPI00081F2493|nr:MULTISPECIES: hypothetical protein [unclassified Streptomyces]MBJ7001631.1 hypothetical protein [Streptomyces sp. CRPSP2-6A1]MYQ95958.1 hypothetical protein [Streptomyces sp. SID4946]SCF97807.1 hypothetical protein GA0115258_121117 [Streptomyces sp. LamerLS-31b]SCF98427.1 hypothetical protein GA0115256_138817 [Streptomyces sp. DconLS]